MVRYCKYCKQDAEFSKDTTRCDQCRARAREYSRRWNERHPEKRQESWQKYAEKYPDRLREAKRKWYYSHPDKVTQQRQNFNAKNPTYYRDWNEANKERQAELARIRYARDVEGGRVKRRAYYAKNKIQFYERCMERRALKRKVTIGKVDLNAVIRRDGWICHICGGLVLREELSFDHIIPLAKGGMHSNDNLAVAHRKCNTSKAARIIPSVMPPPIKKKQR
jgi:5-methylcytosine-specific restriction endonuclease McrA